MNSAQSNSNMQRSAVETNVLEQIRKQGLSISIVSGDSNSARSYGSSVAKETRSKPNVVIMDKSKVSPRSIPVENKTAATHARSIPNSAVETRASSSPSVVSTSQSYHENRTLVPQRANQSNPVVTEVKSFSAQTWCNPNVSSPSEKKPQGNANRVTQTIAVLPETKNQSNRQNVSVLPETKPQVTRNSQNTGLLPENKAPVRVNQIPLQTEPKGQPSQGRMGQCHQLLNEGKVAPNQSRISANTSSAETKIFNNQNWNQNSSFSGVNEHKTTAQQRHIVQMVADPKTCNKLSTNRPVEGKVSNQSRGNQNVKLASDTIANASTRIRPSFPKTTDRKIVSQTVTPTVLTESFKINPFRKVTEETSLSLGEKSFPVVEGKSVALKQAPTRNFIIASEGQSVAHSKNSQTVTVQSDGKTACQVVKNSSVALEPSQKSSSYFVSDISNEGSHGSNSSTLPRNTAAKKTPINSVPVAKKKCIKRSPTVEQAKKVLPSPEVSTLSSSDEASPKKEPQFFSLKSLTPGLTITPVAASTPRIATPVINKIAESTPMKEKVVICPSCKHCSRNPNVCDSCKKEITGAAVYQLNTDRAEKVAVPFVVTKNYVTTTEQIYYHVKNPSQAALLCQNQSFHFQQLVAVQGNEAAPVIRAGAAKPKARPKAKRRCIEPAVCVTISSDDEEESVQESFMPVNEETSSSTHFFQLEMEGDKSGLSNSPSDLIQDENMEADEPQYPGVTNINMRPNEDDVEYEEEEEEEEEPDEEEMDGMDVEEEEDMEEEGEEECSEEEEEEEEDVPPEEETGHEGQLQLRMPLTVKVFNVDHPLKCRSIRIGSLKVHPKGPLSYVPVYLSSDGIAFEAPSLTNPEKFNNVLITENDVQHMLVHFGKCLPIVFVFTTPSFGLSMRKLLCMSEDDYRYFDPESNDDKQKKITLLIDSMTEDQRRYLRFGFSGDQKVKEIDQKTANEILVRSTPNQLPPGKYTIYTHAAIQHESASPVLQQNISLIKLQPQPVIKILTYPPPPQTGGIAITSEDLACLNEGEFLNDAIIDFYLKYVFYEKLSDYDREKTHIFSSYFYPRLTHKPERRPGSSDDGQKTIQFKRHSQVKTWTRHVDIFSKDYIIIPVNQNVHWFLAIICFPGRVPDAPPNVPAKSDAKVSKSADNVTSTDDQDDSLKTATKDGEVEGNSQTQDENSTNSSNNSLYEVEEPPDSEEPLPEAPDSSTHPDGNHGSRRLETPCICIFDSLSGPNRWRIAATLREYLEMEWKMKKGTRKIFDRNTMQGYIMRCPQQTNFHDCGVYLLQYVENFFQNPIPFFGNPMPDLSNWFTEEKVYKKRQQLKELILNLQKKQLANSAANAKKPNQLEIVPASPVTVQQIDNR